MRITENSTLERVKENLGRSRQRMETLQRQTASMRRINRPSDDPTGNATLMKIKNNLQENEQFKRSGDMARTFLDFTDNVLGDVSEVLSRAQELAIQASSSASSDPGARVMVAREVEALKEELISLGNKRFGNRYIFGGHKTNAPPFDATGKYFGDDGEHLIEIEKDTFVAMNVNGNDVFRGIDINQKTVANPDGSEAPQQEVPDANVAVATDLFGMLDNLRFALTTNNTSLIQSSLEPLEAARSRVVQVRAKVGARMMSLDRSQKSMAMQKLHNSELSSRIEDTDLIEVVSDIAKEETVLKASLAASQKLVQPTLIDFLG